MNVARGLRARGAGVVGLLAAVCSVGAIAPAQPGAPSESPVTFVVPGGPTVIYQRVHGTGHVAIEEIHPIGLIHDPAGITQGTHLVEHLRCMGASASFAPGASYGELGAIGLCNAETMGDVTHYDAVVPTADFERALLVIAERGTTLRIDQGLIAQEGPRCHAEVDGVLRMLRSPGLKFALAAAVQSWRHGQTTATLRSGLADWDAASVTDFIATTHAGASMTLAIVGDLEPEEVRRAIEGRFEPGPGVAGVAPRDEIDYGSLAADSVVGWDVESSAVFVVYPPPGDADERLALTLWAMSAGEVLARGEADMARAPATNSHAYPVGELPIFVYAAVSEDGAGEEGGAGVDPSTRTARRLAETLEGIARQPTAGVEGARRVGRALRGMIAQNGQVGYDGAVSMLTPRVGAAQADRLAAGNLALQLGLMCHALGDDPSARLEALLARDNAWWVGVVRSSVNPERRRVTRLEPAGE